MRASDGTTAGRRRRRSLLVVLACVLVGAGLGWWLLKPAQADAKRLPDLTLERYEGGSVALAVTDRPTIVNLWATWCPPCRRELPMLAAAARANPEVRFYFADQGEARSVVEAYLAERDDLVIEGVLLDQGSALSNEFEAVGLPVTLFFDAKGNHVLSHIGEVTEVELLNYLTDLKRGRL